MPNTEIHHHWNLFIDQGKADSAAVVANPDLKVAPDHSSDFKCCGTEAKPVVSSVRGQ